MSGIEYDSSILQSLEDTDFDVNENSVVTIRGVKCAAHTLQLAVEEQSNRRVKIRNLSNKFLINHEML